MLRLRTFGGCWLEQDGRPLHPFSRHRKALALLAAVAAADRGLSRDLAMALLWPESDDARARTSLKQLVHWLRRKLDRPGLFLPSADLHLDPLNIGSDLSEFRDALNGGHYDAAAGLHTGPFLAGFFVRNGGEVERWAAAERSSCLRGYARALEALAEGAAARGDTSTAVEWWHRLVRAQPFSETAAVGLIRALDAMGERAAALQHVREYESLMREEFGEAPHSMVATLSTQLRNSRPGPVIPPEQGQQHAALRVPGVAPSVAVLPFANTSGDPADEHLSDGLTDELIGVLAKLPRLRVTGRTSAFALKGRDLSVRTIAETLGVAAVLEGGIRRAGTRLKVAAQLVNADDNAVIWAEVYDRELKGVFDVQAEIARAIADALRMKFAGGMEDRMTPAPDAEAYESYLKGRYLLNTRPDEDGLLRAAHFFEAAIARVPAYARAYAGLSHAHAFRAIYGYARPHDIFPAALAAARRALELDPGVADAHASLAHAAFVYDFDPVSAEREYRHAINLDPSSTMARFMFAICLSHLERTDEALAQLEYARRTDPLAAYVRAVQGRVHVNARQPDAAISVLVSALELSPGLDLIHQQLGHAYLQKQMYDEAVSAFRRATSLSEPRNVMHLGYAYAVSGRRDEAVELMRRIRDPEPHAMAFHMAMACTGLGQIDEAFAWLERGYDERATFMDGLRVTPAFEPLHPDPRWTALLRRMRLGD